MTARIAVMGFFLAALSVGASGEALTPETYVRADVAAREATLEGMAERVDLLTQRQAIEVQYVKGEASRNRVEAVFSRFGTSGPAHAAYGTRHDAEVTAWLEGQPEFQSRYLSLNARFETLSQRLDALRRGN